MCLEEEIVRVIIFRLRNERQFTHRTYVTEIRKGGQVEDVESAGQWGWYRLHQAGHLHPELVEVVHAQQQSNVPQNLTDYRHQHAWFALPVTVAPRPDEYDQDAWQAALDDRLPDEHVGHLLLNPNLFVRKKRDVLVFQPVAYLANEKNHHKRVLQRNKVDVTL